MPVGGYCYSGDVGECFYENKLKEVEVSAVAGAEPAPQLEPRQDGGQSGDSGGLTLAGLGSGRSTWPGQAMLLSQKAFLAREPGRETGSREGKKGGVVMRSPRLSTAGAKVIKCLMLFVYIGDELRGIPPNTTLLQSDKNKYNSKMEFH